MIYLFLFLFFFLYNIILFFIENLYLLLCFSFFSLFLSFLYRIPIRKHFSFLKKNFLFLFFIVLCNAFLSSFSYSLLVGIRLFLVMHYTFIMFSVFTIEHLRNVFLKLLSPLNIFKIDNERLCFILAIAFTFIPILAEEVRNIKSILLSKGYTFSLFSFLIHPSFYFVFFFYRLFERIDRLEDVLKIQGY